jgi:acyl-CoA thioesterase I
MLGRLLTRGVATGAAIVFFEALYAVLRPAPQLDQFDPSGRIGDPGHPDLRVAVLGDSTVTAPGVDGPHEIWVRRVCERIASQGRHVVLRSFAVGGSMTQDLIRDQLGPAKHFQPDLVIVAVGANDALRGVPKSRFAANLDHLIGELARFGAVVVQSGLLDLGTIPRIYPPLRHLMSRRSTAFHQVHRDVAGRHGAHVVEHEANEREIWLEDRGMWAADLFHVSARGHERWAELAWATVEPLLFQFDESL